MKIVILLALAATIVGDSTYSSSEIVDNASKYEDVYVVKFQKNTDQRYSSLIVSNNGQTDFYDQIIGELNFVNSERKAKQLDPLHISGIKVDHNGYSFEKNGKPIKEAYFTLESDKQTIVKMYRNPQLENSEYDSYEKAKLQHREMFDSGYALTGCYQRRGFHRWERNPNTEGVNGVYLYVYKKNDKDYLRYHIEREKSYSRNGRRAFFDEIKDFKKIGKFYPDSSERILGFDSNGNYLTVAYSLPANNHQLINLENCGEEWIAFYSSDPEISGNNYIYKADSLSDMLDVVKKYERKGVYVIDIENGRVALEDDPALAGSPWMWVAVFSDSPAFKGKYHFRYFTDKCSGQAHPDTFLREFS